MHVLIIRPGAIGDALLAFHILKILKEQDAHITFVSNASVLPLAQAFGLAEETFDYGESSWSEIFSTEGIRTRALQDMLQQIDLAICWLRDPEHVIERNLLKAGVQRIIVALGRPSEGERIHIVDYLATTIGLQHVITSGKLTILHRDEGGDANASQSSSLLSTGRERVGDGAIPSTAPAGDHKGPPRPTQPSSPLRTGSLYRFRLERHAPLRTLEARYVAIHPGSGSASKCWPDHNFTAVIVHLIQRAIPVLLLAGPADAEYVQNMLGHLTSQRASGMLKVLENAPLFEVAEHLQQCRGYLGNDSGITHLAAMLGVPTLALFGPTDPLIWRPIGPSVRVIQEHPLERLQVNVVIDTMSSFYLDEAIESDRTSGIGIVHNIDTSGILDTRKTDH